MSIKKISLCIVVRNESAFIGPCIESACPVADEIIVVDTGSSDRTKKIARNYGAHIISVEYPGDQASAFNIYLGYACGDWILNLDADEVLDPGGISQIRNITKNTEFDGYFFTIWNYSYFPITKWRWVDSCNPLTRGARGYTPSRTVRLFKNHPENQYVGKVHQSINQSILARGGRLGNSRVCIHHYGHLRDNRMTWKLPRYLDMQRKQVDASSHNPRHWYELGMIHLAMGDLSNALASFCEALRLGYGAGALFHIGQTFLKKDDPASSIEYLDRAIRTNDGDGDIDFDLADAWEAIGQSWREIGQPRKAERAYRKALSLRPYNPVVLNDMAVLLNMRGAYSEAKRLMEDFILQYPGFDIPWTTLGINRLEKGNLEEARKAFITALDINPLNRLARLNLALTLELSGYKKEAAKANKLAREGLGSAEAHEYGITPYFPRKKKKAFRQRAGPRCPLPVVSLVPRLAGNTGKVLVNIVKSLWNHSHIVLCGDAGSYAGEGLREELEESGIEVKVVASRKHLLRTLRQIKPGVIINHWCANRSFDPPGHTRCGRWIAVGHTALPMPSEYDAYIIVSDFHARLQEHLPLERIHNISNCIDRDRFIRCHWNKKSNGSVLIAMLSDLDPGKFPRHLLSYLPRLKEMNARIVIAGRGARRHEIEPELHDCGFHEVVRFIGPVSWKQVPEFLGQADIALHLTETYEEVSSVAVLQMLAAGLPVISRPWGNIPELVHSGKNGYLAEKETEIADRLEEIILAPELRNRMGRSSRRRSREFDIKTTGASYRKLINKVMRLKI